MSSLGLRSAATHKLRGFIPTFPDDANHKPLFNTLTATATDLQSELISGNLRSTQIVEEYHRSIVAYNGVLNAVFELAPGAVKRAEELDDLRVHGEFLGPLHGIPILIKDNINLEPSFGLGTSGGALALVESVPASSAPIVDKLLAAGAIILGKTTMSEMAFHKGTGIRCGWSAAAGHVQSAYVRGGLHMADSIIGHSSPDGSSTGSAVAVSAGLAPVSIGTETFGSLVNPATRAALYTIKSTLGIIPSSGIMPISHAFDTPGPMVKSPKDAADLLTILVDPSKTQVPKGGYSSALGGNWKDIKVGTLAREFWKISDDLIKPADGVADQINEETGAVYARLEILAKSYHGNISDVAKDDLFILEDGTDALRAIMCYDIEGDMDEFLGNLTSSRVHTLKELVNWNIEHSEQELPAEYPNQEHLLAGIKDEHDPKRRAILLAHIKAVGAKFLDLFTTYNVDVIIAPTDSPLFRFSGAGGFPIATLPMGCLDFNGRPFGLTVAALPHNEAILLKVMSLWEADFPPRKTPEAYLSLSPID